MAIDGTGSNCYIQKNAGEMAHPQNLKNWKVTNHQYVVEAKLVISTDLYLPLESECVANELEPDFDK